MIGMTLGEAARLIGAQHRGGDAIVASVCTDTRHLKRGDLFVALEGPNFNGHAFLDDARVKGAVGAIVSHEVDTSLPLLVVNDTRLALGRLGAAWRGLVNIPVVAVTGSNGKTTVKEMIAAILGRQGLVLATEGNLNNDIGVPLTLLRLSDRHRYAVIEMGANHSGEIAYLTKLARPNVGVVTNAGPAHLEGFGSVEGVARAKGELFAGLAENGCAVINADDPYSTLWAEMAGQRRIRRFGLAPEADVRADPESIRVEAGGGRLRTVFRLVANHAEVEIALPLAGRHNVRNALAAAAVALSAGIGLEDVRTALEVMTPVPGRLEFKAADDLWVIDDTYNANPASLQAGLEVLAACPGRHWLALGDMGELGQESLALHRAAGEKARAAGVERLFAVGDRSRQAVESFGPGALHFGSHDALVEAVRAEAHEKVTVLVKGSRRMAMERVVAGLLADAGAASA